MHVVKKAENLINRRTLSIDESLYEYTNLEKVWWTVGGTICVKGVSTTMTADIGR